MTDQAINAAIRDATGIQRDDFSFDLNAMHEAEKTFTPNQFVAYAHKLADIVGYAKPINATAAQRSEAFLQSIGKWKD